MKSNEGVTTHVNTAELLHSLSTRSKNQSANSLGSGLGTTTKEVAPVDRVLALVLDTVDDFFPLGNDVRIVHRLVLQVGKDLTGFGLVSVGKQPSKYRSEN